ncbi:MAG: TonB-dependent receptor [Flavobacteriaceae bacterium]
MGKPLYIFICLCFISLSIIAQRPEQKEVTISGKVIDKETNQPLEYATIAFFNKRQNKIVTGGITDIKGEFSIPVLPGMYDITIEYIAFKTITISDKRLTASENIGSFSLEIDTESLEEVEIIAERTTVEIRLDKKIYNVGKDLTVSGGNVNDVLNNVPSVSVDAEGTVALRGNDNVRILINGKPSGLVGLNSSSALQQLPAESIEKVEVITSPSARYEAEGTAGILNIILRRSKLQGLNGAVTALVGNPDAAGISGNINYRTGNVNIFNTVSYNYSEYVGRIYTYTQFKQEGNFLNEERNSRNTRKGLTNNFGVEWYVNESSSITNSFVYNDGNSDNRSANLITQLDPNSVITNETLRLDPEIGDRKTLQYAFNYTKNFETSGHTLSFDFQYEDTTDNEFSLINTDGIDTDILTNLEDETSVLIQADYVKPIDETSQFELGFRGEYADTDTDYRVELLNPDTNMFEIDRNLTNFLNFRNYINAAYAQYGKKIDKFSYLLGLRLENTQLTLDQPTSGDFKKNSYTGLFPTINLNYEFSERESMSLGYNRRISRPRSFFLNPFPSRTSITNIFQGDPGLIPTYSGQFDLSYLNRFGKVTLSSSLYYSHATDIVQFVSTDTGGTVTIDGRDASVIRRSPVNIGEQNRYGFEFNVTYSPNRKWRINTDFNIYRAETRGDYEDTNFDFENTTWTARLSNKLTLPANIDWQTNMNYRGPRIDAQSDRQGVFTTDMALSKDLFKEKASLAFSVRDLLNSQFLRGSIETPTFITERELQFRGGRTFILSFTYRFNQKKKAERPSRGNGGGDIEM